MSKARIIPDHVRDEQHKASNPDWSAWASANAGSGKTHVLTQRVIRLLLQGEDPAKILCITFTKAAAATMATRVFNTLAAWTMLDDEALTQAIRDIGVAPNAGALGRARRLFALALETPGGLKVQTIHAFCTRLLHQFPFEAGVAAGFEVLDDATQSELLEQLSLDVMLEGAANPDTATGRALEIAFTAAADQTFRDLIREAVGKRDAITAWVARAGSVGNAIAQLSASLGIGDHESAQDFEDRILSEAGISSAHWPDLAAVFLTGSKTDCEQADRLNAAFASTGSERLSQYLSVFCTGTGSPRARLVTKKVAEAHPEWAERIGKEQERILELLNHQRAAACRDRTRALVTIAHEVIRRYRGEKTRRGLLDYDDLIDRTLELFRRTSAAWVLYKLDLGINHLLLDEAQDTSPKQWEIIDTLVSEFTSGEGARSVKRTMFAVGDDKQSIYSFQGANPVLFDEYHRKFRKAFESAEQVWTPVKLKTSFRSLPSILDAVDDVFKRPQAHQGFATDKAGTAHEALPGLAPGTVEIWPLMVAEPKRDIEGWDAPFDTASETSPQVRPARRIARHVAIWNRNGGKSGDVLILVRQRGPLFEAIIRALKGAGLPVAGADRMVLVEHIAVMDLMALADALLLPEDDLALASVLKSPLFGLTDDDLFRIAWNRGRRSLRAALSANGDFASVAQRLNTLGEAALRDSPFTFYARLLGPGNGRRQFLERLGLEANDALDEFLNLALDYEKREAPSLQGFVAWLRAVNAEVKRDMEMGRDELRVMTVHGAKGLEAKTVILADTTGKPEGSHPPRLIEIGLPGGNGVVWTGSKDEDPAIVGEARKAAQDAQADEYRRLLYVAMTRAEQRLVVCGVSRPLKKDGTPSIPENCWYQLIEDALVRGTEPLAIEVPAEDDPASMIWRYRKSAPYEAAKVAENMPRATIPAPGWLNEKVAADDLTAIAVTPSQMDDADISTHAGAAEREQALKRGRLMHRLIQSLPDLPMDAREDAAHEYLRRNGDLFSPEEREALAGQALAILNDSQFAALFAPGSRAEVPIVGTLLRDDRPPYAVSGQIDRLVVTDEHVLIADYKTNRPAPTALEAVPRAYRRQLALYRALLQKVYPGRTIRAALVWTDVPSLMELPQAALDAELATLTSA